jgi:hypothetical protein
MTRRTVSELYAGFTTAFHELDKLDGLDYPRSDADEKRYIAVLDLCTKQSRQIVKTRAGSIEEMLLKIRAAGWLNGTSEPLDRWTRCADQNIEDCLVSIRKDLQAMQAAPSRSGSRRSDRRLGAAASA